MGAVHHHMGHFTLKPLMKSQQNRKYSWTFINFHPPIHEIVGDPIRCLTNPHYIHINPDR